MKKIISLIISMAIIATVISSFALVASANTPTMSIAIENKSAEFPAVGSTFDLVVTYSGVPTSENEDDWSGTAVTLLQFKVKIPDYDSLYTKNGKTYNIDTVGTASGTKSSKNIVDGEWLFSTMLAQAADSAYRVGDGEVARLKLKVTGDITKTLDFAFSGTDEKIETKTYTAEEALASQGFYYASDSTLVLEQNAKIEVKNDPYKTIEGATIISADGGTTKNDGDKTAEQIGGAGAISFTLPTGVTMDNYMIWSITDATGKHYYSEKVNAGLSAIGEGTVKAVATFVTGSHLEGEGRNPYEIKLGTDGVNGIFKGSDGNFYLTDAADWTNYVKPVE